MAVLIIRKKILYLFVITNKVKKVIYVLSVVSPYLYREIFGDDVMFLNVMCVMYLVLYFYL